MTMQMEPGHHRECPVPFGPFGEECLCAELSQRDREREAETPLEESYRLHYDPDFTGGDEW